MPIYHYHAPVPAQVTLHNNQAESDLASNPNEVIGN